MQNHIKKYRQLYKLRQSDLSEKLGVSRVTIIFIESSKHEPSLGLAFKMARLFNCSIEELFDDK
ncbi:MAG TPA: helix-turn-helix transcriptional regulator [Candidatus Nanoarchaeia archaeon]|nr:helix-turn-helix transcriptional regulator [Candidatus Nanoarchaeia archaeon]